MLRKPYLLFLGDVAAEPYAKTAFGLRDWCPGDVAGQMRLEGCAVDLGLSEMSCRAAAEAGVGSLVIGVAPMGGALPVHWLPALTAALEAGLDVVSGLHQRLAAIPELVAAAARGGAHLRDVRHTETSYPIATGRKRSGLRLLTVGTDCAVGKKYTALTAARALREAGADATFRATGQTGIMIAGQGIPIDAVVCDFVAGAAEILSPDAGDTHWDVVEGQGSLFHPAYAGVTLGLLHGTQPDALILCHDPTRTTIAGYPDFPIPALAAAIARYEADAYLTNRDARCVGISINTSKLAEAAADRLMDDTASQLGLPVFDPVKQWPQALTQRLRAIADAWSAA